MSRSEAFNTLFNNGYGYQFYTQRSDRHLDRMKLSYNATEEYLKSLDDKTLNKVNRPLKVLCIAENWCGDCGNGVPVIAKIAEIMDQWEFQIASRDDYNEIVEKYYTTAGRKKIPIIIFADEDGDEIYRWVERPAISYEILDDLKQKKLPKEEYIQEYRENPELRPPNVSKNILDEILTIASKAAILNSILPKKQ